VAKNDSVGALEGYRPMALAFENLKLPTVAGMRFAHLDKDVLSMPNCHGDTDVWRELAE